MITCPDQFKLFDYAENELSPQEAQHIADHLQVCDVCRRAVATMRMSHGALASVAPVSPPQNLLQAIQDAIATQATGITCSSAHELISASLDGELIAADAIQLDAHLIECADCRYFAERMGIMTSALRAIPSVSPMPGLKTRIEAAVDKASGIGNIFQRTFTRRAASFAGIAAAAALMFAIIFNFAPISGINVSPDQPMPQTIATAPISPKDAPTATTPAVPEIVETVPVATNPDANISAAPKAMTKTHSATAQPARRAPAASTNREYRVASTTGGVTYSREMAPVTSAHAPAHTISPRVRPTSPAATAIRPPVHAAPVNVRPGAIAAAPVVPEPAGIPVRVSTPAPRPTEARQPKIERPAIVKATPDINIQLPAAEKKTSFVPMRVASAAISEGPVHMVKTSYVPVREETAHSVALSGNSLASDLAASRERISKKADAMASSATDGKIVIIK